MEIRAARPTGRFNADPLPPACTPDGRVAAPPPGLSEDRLKLRPTSCKTGSPVPNGFRMEGWNDPPSVGGSLAQNLHQAKATVELTAWAVGRALHPDKTESDHKLQDLLAGLAVTEPLPGERDSFHRYTSHVPNASAQALFDHFVNEPGAVFGAAGLSFLPAPAKLENGLRLAIEYAGYPGFLSPVEVRLNPETKEISFQSLDGHFFRGANTFQFKDDGHGNAVVEQTMRFQGASVITNLGLTFGHAMALQHHNWTQVHAHLYAHH